MKIERIVLLVLVLAIPACFADRNETIQEESLGYFRFIGNLEGTTVTAVKDEQVILSGLIPMPATNYSVRPGVYPVTIPRAGASIVTRKLFVADGQILEVRIP
jgi:hypothetical protein